LFFIDSAENVREFHSGHPPYATQLFYVYYEGGMISTPDGKLIGVGGFTTNPGETDDHWVFMTTDLRKYVPESTAGLDEINRQELNTYPVPFSSELTIHREKDFPAVIQLLDLSGKCILEKPIDQRIEKIPTDGLSAGTYLLRLHENGIQKNMPVVKE
jgi:hypothetical protein